MSFILTDHECRQLAEQYPAMGGPRLEMASLITAIPWDLVGASAEFLSSIDDSEKMEKFFNGNSDNPPFGKLMNTLLAAKYLQIVNVPSQPMLILPSLAGRQNFFTRLWVEHAMHHLQSIRANSTPVEMALLIRYSEITRLGDGMVLSVVEAFLREYDPMEVLAAVEALFRCGEIVDNGIPGPRPFVLSVKTLRAIPRTLVASRFLGQL